MGEVPPDAATAVASGVPPLAAAYTRLDMLRDFRRTFEADHARRVLGHLLSWCRLGAPGLQDGMTASESLLIHEGKRSVGLALMSVLAQAEPDEPTDYHEEKVTYGGYRRHDRPTGPAGRRAPRRIRAEPPGDTSG